ncbi:hypothetical protein CF327_g6838 [Tilletia walkeri]|nr:hypothetical protein CF327_g6838 [Tilletia walkeri]
MSFHDQLLLHPTFRRLTAFRSPRGHRQKTSMPQGYTDDPAVAKRTADHIGGKDVPHNFVPFIGDYGAKGPFSHYDHETLPGTTIRRWLYKFAITIERLLYRLKYADLVVSGAKMVVITNEIKITGVRVGFDGKRADPAKIDNSSPGRTLAVLSPLSVTSSALRTSFDHSSRTSPRLTPLFASW